MVLLDRRRIVKEETKIISKFFLTSTLTIMEITI
jgi:hypothetical protein